jgi:hypothetical protein
MKSDSTRYSLELRAQFKHHRQRPLVRRRWLRDLSRSRLCKRSAIMATYRNCVDYARECVRLAEQTEDPDMREWLLQKARDWMASAMHEGSAGSAPPPC